MWRLVRVLRPVEHVLILVLGRREVVPQAAEIAATQGEQRTPHMLDIALMRRHAILRQHHVGLAPVGRGEALGEFVLEGC